MNIFGLAALGLVGAGSAKVIDRFAGEKYTYNWKVSDTRTVKVTPGAMVSLGTALLLALIPGSNAAGFRLGLAALAIGGTTIEGGELVQDHVLPMLDQKAAVAGKALPGYGGKQLPAGAAQQHVGAGPYAGQRALDAAFERWGRGPRRRAA